MSHCKRVWTQGGIKQSSSRTVVSSSLALALRLFSIIAAIICCHCIRFSFLRNLQAESTLALCGASSGAKIEPSQMPLSQVTCLLAHGDLCCVFLSLSKDLGQRSSQVSRNMREADLRVRCVCSGLGAQTPQLSFGFSVVLLFDIVSVLFCCIISSLSREQVAVKVILHNSLIEVVWAYLRTRLSPLLFMWRARCP